MVTRIMQPQSAKVGRCGSGRCSMHWAVVALVTVACVVTPATASEKRATGNLTVAFAAEPTTLDAARYSAGVDLYGVTQIFEQLARPDRNGKWINWLAQSWEIKGTDDKPIIEVKVRPGVKFHNGDPLTAADFEMSYQRLRNPKLSRWTHYQEAVERFEVVDDLTFRLHFKEPDSNYVASYLRLWAMPNMYIAQVGDDGFAKAPVGTGPWKFKSWKPKDEMVFEAFDDYWNEQF